MKIKLVSFFLKQTPIIIFPFCSNLSDNRLETLPGSFFSGNLKLDVITVSMNRISIVYPHLFSSLDKLRVLDLSWNNIWSAECKREKNVAGFQPFGIVCFMIA